MNKRPRKRPPPNAQQSDESARAASKRLWLKGILAGIGCLLLIAAVEFVVRTRPQRDQASKTAAIDVAAGDTVETVATSARLPTLPGLDQNRFDAVVRSVARREDPVLDGWASERFNELANAQLKIIGKMLAESDKLDRTYAASVADESFVTARIRPSRLRQVFADKSLTVKRVGSGNENDLKPVTKKTLQGLDGLVTALRQQAEPLNGLSDVRFKFKIVRVDQRDERVDTTAYFQISGRGPERAVQVNSTWNCRWLTVADPEAPKLANIVVDDYEEIVYHSALGPMFADCTESVFRNSDRFGRQLVYGIDHWTERFDGAIARPAAGHGIAIGDVNGDGLEDVYLCQSPGLPNLLLIQNPDGTVTDTAPAAGVNWLEGTRAALLADLDNDGDQDLVAVLGGKVVIQANDGHGMFELKSIVSSVSSLFAINAVDFDADNDLDLFICGYTLSSGVNLDDVFANPMPFHDANNGAPNVMLRNDGGWNFTDVTENIGLGENSMRFSYASAWDD